MFLKTPTVVTYFFQLLTIVHLPHFSILLLAGAQYSSGGLIRKKRTVCLLTCNADNFYSCVCEGSVELMGHSDLLCV